MTDASLNKQNNDNVAVTKIIKQVPTLAWGKGKDCTFIGALEAALSVTEYPYSYSDMLGYSGLAFRTRWFCGNEQTNWCPSCAVGEMEEEIQAIRTTTGWPLLVEVMNPKNPTAVGNLKEQIVYAIDANMPVLAYSPRLDMGVIYGYKGGGETFLMHDYSTEEEALKLTILELGFLLLFIDRRKDALSEKQAVIFALMSAVRNWRRERFAAGPGEYWYGKSALEHWTSDLNEVEKFSADEQATLHSVSWWNYITMLDARKTASEFLTENAVLLENGQAEDLIKITAKVYRNEVELLQAGAAKGMFLEPSENWGAKLKELEIPVLEHVQKLETVAVMQIEKALQVIDL